MNYLLELKAFYDWIEVNRLPASTIAMWHGLMCIANKTGWQQEFTVSSSVLETKTGLKKEAQHRARNALKQLGRIDWKSGVGRKSATYSIIPFSAVKPTQNVTQYVTQSVTQYATQKGESSDIIYKTKQNKTYTNKPDGRLKNKRQYTSEEFAKMLDLQ